MGGEIKRRTMRSVNVKGGEKGKLPRERTGVRGRLFDRKREETVKYGTSQLQRGLGNAVGANRARKKGSLK